MANWGDRLGDSTNFRQIGVGQSLPPDQVPKYESVLYRSWRDGIDLTVPPEELGEASVVELLDLVVNSRGGVRRAPGIVLVEDVAPRSLRWLFLHPSLDYASELVAIDAPYLGYKRSGGFVFNDEGIIPPGQYGWNAVDINGVLVFSDGSSSTYARENIGDTAVVDISDKIIARTFANMFGRTFAGAYSDPFSGVQNLGVRWTGSSAEYDDWDGAGSGAELLISNSLVADKLVAIRPIGFDALGLLCRHSLWLGYETQIANRPADFRIRRVNLGCVAEPTAVVTPDGIVFLADDGVYLFNQNVSQLLSAQINDQLLPIDFANIDLYKGVYLSQNVAYLLQTPNGTFIYEFPQPAAPNGRWTKRSFAYDNIVLFADQSAVIDWDDYEGTWDEQTVTWNELAQTESNSSASMFVGADSKLGMEQDGVEDYLGVEMTPLLESPSRGQVAEMDQEVDSVIYETHGFELEYESEEDATIRFVLPNEDGFFTQNYDKVLLSTGGLIRRGVVWLPIPLSGQGLKMQYQIVEGQLSMFRIRQIYMPAGPVAEPIGLPDA